MSINTRTIALEILLSVFRDKQHLSDSFSLLSKHALSSSDIAFVKQLCFGVCRHYQRLEAIATTCLSKPLPPKHQDVFLLILIGLYQLSDLAVPAYAAIHATVEALPVKKRAAFKDLVNAILRRYQRDTKTLEEKAQQTPHVSAAMPKWLYKKICTDWPEQAAMIFQAMLTSPPMTLRVSSHHITRGEYAEQLQDAGKTFTLSEHTPDAIYLSEACPTSELPGFSQGIIRLQDEASQFAADLLDLTPGLSVLDVCAAPGGKTCHLLSRMKGNLSVTALDPHHTRFARLKQNLADLHLDADCHCCSLADYIAEYPEKCFDRILLDAPCSGLGIIRRHPDIKHLRQLTDFEKLTTAQSQLLRQAWELLSPGGKLLYSTCSIAPEENARQIEHFVQTHTDAEPLPCHVPFGIDVRYGYQILPGDHPLDGFYYALLMKKE